MSSLSEDKLSEIVIDFGHMRNPELKEGFLESFGFMVKSILKRIFGGSAPNLSVRGRPVEVDAFAKAIKSETNYLAMLRDYGLDDPRSYRNKAKLKSSVKNFERKTGVKWPFEV